MTNNINPIFLISLFPLHLRTQPSLSWSLPFTRLDPYLYITHKSAGPRGWSWSHLGKFYSQVCWFVGWRWGFIFIGFFRCSWCFTRIIVANSYFVFLVPLLGTPPFIPIFEPGVLKLKSAESSRITDTRLNNQKTIFYKSIFAFNIKWYCMKHPR